jgi:acyl-CoA synthetase (AMP-forming)/AMP-acid ligase II
MNIIEPILFQMKCQPEAPALCAHGSDIVSYARLATRMNIVARRAMSIGLKPGDVVALSITDQLLHSIVILGLTQIGIIPISVAMQRPPPGLKIAAVISNTNYPFAPQARHLPLDFTWVAGDGTPVEAVPGEKTRSDQTCRIILTSGTTGTAKAVALSHRLAMARNERFQFLLGNRHPACSRVYLNIGVATSLGYYFLIYILSRGGTLFLRGEDIEETLRSFGIFRMQALVGSVSNLTYLVDLCERDPSLAFHVDTIFCGGSVISRAMLERVRPRLCSHLFCRYSATETGTTATAPAEQIVHIPGAVGYVAPGVSVQIVDDSGRCRPAGQEGIVRIASEVAVDGYFDDPETSSEFFRDGWFYPGDIGSLTPDNLLIISGRSSSVLNVGGGKISAEKIEVALMSFKGVSEAAVFMVSSPRGAEEVWAAIVCSEKVDGERLREHCRPRMPAVFVPARIVTLDALPINATGKVDRPRLKQIVEAATHSGIVT